MVVYIGHSPFHSGSVALIFNALKVHVSPQYHVVFNEYFSTVTYMEAGVVPLNLPAPVKYSSERATSENFSLAEKWSTSNYDSIADPVHDPFSIVVPNKSNATPPDNAHVSPDLSPDTLGISVSEEDHPPTSGTKRKSTAVCSREKVMNLSNSRKLDLIRKRAAPSQ